MFFDAKETPCDKDWSMIRQLIEADYVNMVDPSNDKIKSWFMESRIICLTFYRDVRTKEMTSRLEN